MINSILSEARRYCYSITIIFSYFNFVFRNSNSGIFLEGVHREAVQYTFPCYASFGYFFPVLCSGTSQVLGC